LRKFLYVLFFLTTKHNKKINYTEIVKTNNA